MVLTIIIASGPMAQLKCLVRLFMASNVFFIRMKSENFRKTIFNSDVVAEHWSQS